MGKPYNGPLQPFRKKVLIALVVGFGLLALAGPLLFFRSASTEPMTVSQFEAARSGEAAHVVGEVLDVGADGFRFEVLEGPAEELKRTGTVFEARGTEYRVSLGEQADVKQGAIVLAGGVKRDDWTIAPSVILILTGKVPSPR